MCLSHDLSTYLCIFCHISIKLFDFNGKLFRRRTLIPFFALLALGEILKSRFHWMCTVWTWKIVETYWIRFVQRYGTWYRLALCTCHCCDDVPSFFSPSCMDTEVSSQHRYIVVYCCHLLLRFVSTYTHNLSIASFNFMYRTYMFAYSDASSCRVCEFLLLFGQMFILQENRIRQQQIMFRLSQFRFNLICVGVCVRHSLK